MSRMTRRNVPSRITRPWTKHTHHGTGTLMAELNGGQREYRRITCRPRYAALARTWIFSLPFSPAPSWLRTQNRGA